MSSTHEAAPGGIEEMLFDFGEMANILGGLCLTAEAQQWQVK